MRILRYSRVECQRLRISHPDAAEKVARNHDLCSPQKPPQHVACSPLRRTQHLASVCPCNAGGIALDEVHDPVYAHHGDAGSAATSVTFALLRDTSVIKVRDVPFSLWATAAFRRAGARSAIVTVDGRYPVLVTAGSIKCGRLLLRCKTIPIELGAGTNGSLVLGERVFINTGATVVATHSIVIGDDCLIGDLVAIFDTDFHPMEPSRPTRTAPVRLGANVWVGRSSMILPGVTIGDHAIIAAGSVVTGDVPARTLMAGTPARPIRTLDIPDGWRRE
jgi:acetyltransferase-like isoleucine patch superfamily enzyme